MHFVFKSISITFSLQNFKALCNAHQQTRAILWQLSLPYVHILNLYPLFLIFDYLSIEQNEGVQNCNLKVCIYD